MADGGQFTETCCQDTNKIYIGVFDWNQRLFCFHLHLVHVVWLEFFIDIKSFRSHYGSGVDSASNRNEYEQYFLGVKAAGE